MAKYRVLIDVIMTGDIEIEAKSKKEAKELAKSCYFYSNDLGSFHQIDTRVVEVQGYNAKI